MSPERLEITRRKIANAMTECRFVVSIIPGELSWLLEQQAALTAATEENKRLKERVGELERVIAEFKEARDLAIDKKVPLEQGIELYENRLGLMFAALNPERTDT